MNVSMGRVLGATGIVLVTTLDDAVWLVPFVAQVSNRRTAGLHALLFVATLVSMAAAAALIALLAETSVLSWLSLSETGLTAVAVILCWSLALVLLYKSIQKQHRRRKQRAQQEQQQQQRQNSNETDPLVEMSNGNDDDETNQQQQQLQQQQQQLHDQPTSRVDESPRPWMVISLTFLGSLDEICYLPSLILGGIFNGVEICLGTALAALVMLVIVLVFLRQCKPLMDLLDRIPLYGVVTLFASILTIELVWDILSPE